MRLALDLTARASGSVFRVGASRDIGISSTGGSGSIVIGRLVCVKPEQSGLRAGFGISSG
jgi:hypothetical protein